VSETGSVKFRYEQIEEELALFRGFDELNACRAKLLQMRLLGVDRAGVGFGNVSVRDRDTNSFYISGTGTGGLPYLSLGDCARVGVVDFEKNWLRCEGLTVASAESLTHAAIYAAAPEVHAVIHAHSRAVWAKLCRQPEATSPDVEYGTATMANEIARLFRDTDVRERKVFAMAGHEEGVVAFGETLARAFGALISCLE
jgi:ribulose-5-phosphate 4-epimerase/fuculose-1-phosphate aldolase